MSGGAGGVLDRLDSGGVWDRAVAGGGSCRYVENWF